MYFFVDTVFTDQVEFDIFAWDGATWTWPEAAGSSPMLWGKCSEAVKNADIETIPGPSADELSKKCFVQLHPQKGFGGTALKLDEGNKTKAHSYLNWLTDEVPSGLPSATGYRALVLDRLCCRWAAGKGMGHGVLSQFR